MTKKIKLEDWAVESKQSEFHAPETTKIYLSGKAYGHERFEDGKRVSTSSVKDINGKEITTSSGSIYVLGEPAKEYIEYLESINYDFDPENPIKDKRNK